MALIQTIFSVIYLSPLYPLIPYILFIFDYWILFFKILILLSSRPINSYLYLWLAACKYF